MRLDLNAELRRLAKMTVHQLRDRYGEVFGEPTRSGNKDFLIKRIAWRVQANAEGGALRASAAAGGGVGRRR